MKPGSSVGLGALILAASVLTVLSSCATSVDPNVFPELAKGGWAGAGGSSAKGGSSGTGGSSAGGSAQGGSPGAGGATAGAGGTGGGGLGGGGAGGVGGNAAGGKGGSSGTGGSGYGGSGGSATCTGGCLQCVEFQNWPGVQYEDYICMLCLEDNCVAQYAQFDSACPSTWGDTCRNQCLTVNDDGTCFCTCLTSYGGACSQAALTVFACMVQTCKSDCVF